MFELCLEDLVEGLGDLVVQLLRVDLKQVLQEVQVEASELSRIRCRDQPTIICQSI